VPVDHHTGAVVPLVPLGHEVRGPGAELLGVARAPTNRRRPLIALAIGIVCALAMGRIAQYLVVSVGIESKLTERIYGLSAGIAVGMTVTSIGLVYGLAGEPTTATKPREIVRSDFVYGLMGGLAVGLAVGPTGAAFGFIDGPLGSLEYRLALGPAPGLAAGLAFTGAGAGCRYLVFLLCSRGNLPWRVAAFLDWACAAGLIRLASGHCLPVPPPRTAAVAELPPCPPAPVVADIRIRPSTPRICGACSSSPRPRTRRTK
jgi:hypothetical protein